MKTKLVYFFTLLLFVVVSPIAAQNANSSNKTPPAAAGGANANSNAKRRGPVFRASKEQITQAQALLKQRGHYGGEPTGKLDDATRAGLRKYQEAEGVKVTGTLNALTLEKMGIPLTDRQKEIWKQMQTSQANANPR